MESLIVCYDEYTEKSICPTEAFLINTGSKDFWKSMRFYDKDKNVLKKKVMKTYSLKKRMTYGLPIEPKKYELANKWLTKTNLYK